MTHDDLQEDFAAFWRQDVEPPAVDDKQIGLEIFSQQTALASSGGLKGKLAHQVEHRAVEHQETGLDRFEARESKAAGETDCLSMARFADSGSEGSPAKRRGSPPHRNTPTPPEWYSLGSHQGGAKAGHFCVASRI